MRCSMYVNVGRMLVRLNGGPLKEVKYFKYLGRKWQRKKGENDRIHIMNEDYTALEALKGVLSNRKLRINAKKCIFEGVIIVPTALYGAEAWGMRNAERRKVNVLEMKCLRSLVAVSLLDTDKDEFLLTYVNKRKYVAKEITSPPDETFRPQLTAQDVV